MTENTATSVSRVQELVYELTIAEVMTPDVVTVTPHTSMREFKELLRQHRISGTPVVDGAAGHKGKLLGVISLEDLIRALEQGDMDAMVADKMTADIETLQAGESVIQAVNRLARFGYGRLPVVDASGALVGILTRGDIIRGLLRRLEMNYHEQEIERYRASHIFEDIVSDRTSLVLRYRVAARDFSAGGGASSKIKRAIERLGGKPSIARRVAVAAYESEMNLVIHTEAGGEILVEIQPDQVQIVVTDKGPGIGDVEQAMRPGYSTAPEWIREMGFGAGMGLLNIKKCADRMELASEVGRGTTLWISFDIPPAEAPAKPGEAGEESGALRKEDLL
ncbi:MAG: CBS domain-containing protein [Anaerolineae bacterium]|nr:CBS domain-containing protein [Anaerolineae bacterium]